MAAFLNIDTQKNMTSKPNTARLILSYFDAFNQGEIKAMLNCLHDDVVHDVNQGERRFGKEQFHAFSEHMARCYKERLSDIVIMVSEDGSRASAEFVVHGEYLSTDEGLPEATGQTYHLPAGSFFAVNGDKITRVTTYYNLNDWIDQVSQ